MMLLKTLLPATTTAVVFLLLAVMPNRSAAAPIKPHEYKNAALSETKEACKNLRYSRGGGPRRYVYNCVNPKLDYCYTSPPSVGRCATSFRLTLTQLGQVHRVKPQYCTGTLIYQKQGTTVRRLVRRFKCVPDNGGS